MLKYLFTIMVLAFIPANLLSADTPDIIGVIHTDTSETLFGYRIIPLGDQNGDGYDDFMTWDYRHKAFIYYGGDTTNSDPNLIIDSVNTQFDNMGDVNGDGYFDFVIPQYNTTDIYKRKLWLCYGGPLLDDKLDIQLGWDSLFASGPSGYGTDINHNGIKEIVSQSNTEESILFFDIESNPDSIPDMVLYTNLISGFHFGEGLITGDFNDDGNIDLIANVRQRWQESVNGELYIYWGGPAMDDEPDMIIQRPGVFEMGFEEFGRILENLGDVNGDGVDDIYAGSGNGLDTVGFIYFGGSNIDDAPDVIIPQKFTVARAANDIDKDGYNDLIAAYPLPIASLGYVFVYYGGSEMDSLPDIEINNSEYLETQEYFGQDVSGIGDFNNDGVDDFAFSAIEYSLEYWSRGVVYVMSGIGESSDVEIEHDAHVPEKIELYQNYPNPFNPSTTIAFEIPYRSHVIITVQNILGQEVARLIDKELSTGSYSVRWDGNDQGGETMPTGVYLYRMAAGDAVISRKMILIK